MENIRVGIRVKPKREDGKDHLIKIEGNNINYNKGKESYMFGK